MNISKQKVEVIMAQKGLTRSDVASACGYSVQWVSTLINKRSCQPATAQNLAVALGVNVTDIASTAEGV